MKQRRNRLSLRFERLESRTLLAADVVVSELMASNRTTLFDFDGNTSDWFELTNVGDESANLKNWYVTDRAAELTRWQIPIDTVIGPGESTTIFASGRDRVMPTGELHTNFQLARGGEFLGLVRPDGRTVAWQTPTDYPIQFPDVSFGQAQPNETTRLVSTTASGEVHVPGNETLGTTWTSADFVTDENWQPGDSPFGYAVTGQLVRQPGFSVRMIDVNGGTDGTLDSAQEARQVLALDAPSDDYMITKDLSATASTIDFGGAGGDFRDDTTPYLDGTVDTSLDDFAMRVTAEVTIPAGDWMIGFGSGDGGVLRLQGVTFTETYGESDNAVAGDDEIIFDGTRRHIWTRGAFTVDPGGLTTTLDLVYFDRDGSDSLELGINAEHTSARPRIAVKNGWELLHDQLRGWGVSTMVNLPAPTYGLSVAADLSDKVFGQSTSVYLRYPFSIEEAAAFDELLLNLRYDDAFVAYLNGVEVTREGISGEPAWDSTSTAERTGAEALTPRQFDVTQYQEQLRIGNNVLAIHLISSGLQSNGMFVAPELVGITNGDDGLAYFAKPTPGSSNAAGTVAVASAVEFSHADGTFTDTFQLEMSSPSAQARIHFTTDGTVPTESSFLYARPIEIADTAQIRARAFAPGAVGSQTSSRSYVRVAEDAADFSSNLPLVLIENFDRGIPDRAWQPAFGAIFETGEDGRSRLTDQPALTSRLGIHRRGSSTFEHEKTNFRIEFHDEWDLDRSVSLLGLPDESDFVLFGPWLYDRTMVRNPFIFELSRQAGLYSPRTRFVEVFADTDGDGLSASDYMGVYVLMEEVKRGRDRIDIENLSRSDLSADEITGGYIWKNDRGEEPDRWKSARGLPSVVWYVHDDPDGTQLHPEQTNYIRSYLDEFEAALFGPNFADPEQGYQAYVDVDSFITGHILRTLSNDPDGLRLSQYWYKDRDDKIHQGPLWDFDRTMGNDSDSRSNDPRRWNPQSVNYLTYDWWGRLFQDVNFAQQWIDKYHGYREAGLLSDNNFAAIIDRHAAEIAEAQSRNYDRWPDTAPNGGQYAQRGLDGWAAELSHLKGWLRERIRWLDGEFTRRPTVLTSEMGPDAFSVNIQHSVGDIVYYTLDGTDPRASDGQPSANANVYAGAFDVAGGTTIIARAFDSDRILSSVDTPISWSGRVLGSAGPPDTQVPQVTSFQRGENARQLSELTTLEFTFSEDVASSIDTEDLVLTNLTTGNRLDMSAAQLDYDATIDSARWDLRGIRPVEGFSLGHYVAALSGSGIHDRAGNRLNNGNDYVAEFTLTVAGDSNLDFIFDSSDLVAAFQVGQYEDDQDNNSSWQTGDWDGNGEFDSSDLVLAFQAGTYVRAIRGLAC